ncbi:MAG: response regulator [Thermodesulfobacteriota bacterium]
MGRPERHIRLLIVDDEVDYLDVLQKRLTKRGLMVMTASSGSQAIQTLRGHQFEVAVLDLKMQDMDGIEVLKIFKKMDPRLEVIMLTGHGSEQAARDGIALGAFDYLTKPCDLAMLYERIQAAAAARPPGDETADAR